MRCPPRPPPEGEGWRRPRRRVGRCPQRAQQGILLPSTPDDSLEERPDPSQVRKQFEDLSGLLDRAPERARETARRLLTDITLTPAVENGERVYEAVSRTPISGW